MLGKIISTSDEEVLIKLNINLYEIGNLVNKNVIFEDENKLMGEIIKLEESLAHIVILGEFINDSFYYGTSNKPSFKANARVIKKEELDIIYKQDENSNLINLGNSYIYKNYPISISVNSFFANHFAILGNTGSGKSYSVARIIQSIFYDAQRIPYKTNIFLFDAYGEYENAFNPIGYDNENINYKVYTTDLTAKNKAIINIPFWLLSVDDICLLLEVDNTNQIGIIEKALKLVNYFAKDETEVLKQKTDIIARAILDIIFSGENPAYIRNKVTSILTKFNTSILNLNTPLMEGGWCRTIKQCIYVEKNSKFANIELLIKYLENQTTNTFNLSLPDQTFKYDLKDFADALDFALISEGIYSTSSVFEYANILKTRVNNLINSEYSNYFKYPSYVKKEDYIKKLLTSDNGKKVQVVNFNINYIDDRMAKVIVKIYSKMLFDFAIKIPNRAKFPIHIILEEAHRYIQNDNDVSILGYNIFERIAKEGRKYGILLGMISQRPSEISATALSQCSNFLVFKMFYPKDIEFIASVIPNAEIYLVNKIKLLPVGTCISFGNAFKMPSLIKIEKPNPEPLSSSSNIDECWYK